jgi:hypothetical protein
MRHLSARRLAAGAAAVLGVAAAQVRAQPSQPWRQPQLANRPRMSRGSKAEAAAAAAFEPGDEEKSGTSAGSAGAASKRDLDEPAAGICPSAQEAAQGGDAAAHTKRARLTCSDLWDTECGPCRQ